MKQFENKHEQKNNISQIRGRSLRETQGFGENKHALRKRTDRDDLAQRA